MLFTFGDLAATDFEIDFCFGVRNLTEILRRVGVDDGVILNDN